MMIVPDIILRVMVHLDKDCMELWLQFDTAFLDAQRMIAERVYSLWHAELVGLYPYIVLGDEGPWHSSCNNMQLPWTENGLHCVQTIIRTGIHIEFPCLVQNDMGEPSKVQITKIPKIVDLSLNLRQATEKCSSIRCHFEATWQSGPSRSCCHGCAKGEGHDNWCIQLERF